MTDYQTMYYKLFGAISDAMEILQKAQTETEQMFIDAPISFPTQLKLVEKPEKENMTKL